MKPFEIIEPEANPVPLIISIPHVGIQFPEELEDAYLLDQMKSVDDTDWFLDELYSFATAMGITIIKAVYSRWVIDLNRDPESKPLYNDGRIITGLCTTTDFLGNPIYKDGNEPDESEIKRRIAAYYQPYYDALALLLEDRKKRFGNVLLWDAHSIRERVPTIREEPFPAMILGDADERSADVSLINIALEELGKGYSINHNDPFKGGHITRFFGDPQNKIHALQLERNKNLYMDNAERQYDSVRAKGMQGYLKNTLEKLINQIQLL
jgi:N-formylglutamate deformylase